MDAAFDEPNLIAIDPTHKRVYGRAKQGAQIGRFKGVRTLHPLLATPWQSLQVLCGWHSVRFTCTG
ncbi:hypothetical protein MOQ72_43040 [Saccharopolyspora sp. K220]|uniref:hypothetical protein n=1 Tax=Saccharopolyspora soli TaxID=2926618 RepID=UPI001F58A38F|nr:hypothetical protein [Saccharopolyspora soli]MCI2424192.1 hypothetical protein [Saccharopolyspora soli]